MNIMLTISLAQTTESFEALSGIPLKFVQDGLMLVAMISIPVAAAALAATLLTGVVQSATQIQDQTVSNVPRMIAVYAVAIALFSTAMSAIVSFGTASFQRIAQVQRPAAIDPSSPPLPPSDIAH